MGSVKSVGSAWRWVLVGGLMLLGCRRDNPGFSEGDTDSASGTTDPSASGSTDPTVASQSGSASTTTMTTDSTSGSDVTGDDTLGDTTMQVTTGPTTSTGSTGTDCEQTEVKMYHPESDTFLAASEEQNCWLGGMNSYPGPCQDLNFGISPEFTLSEGGITSVYAITFGIGGFPGPVLSAWMEFFLEGGGGNQIPANFSIDAFKVGNAFPWREGNKDKQPATGGDSTWVYYDAFQGLWPGNGPLQAAPDHMGGGNFDPNYVNPVTIYLDAALVESWWTDTNNGLLLYSEGLPPHAINILTIEIGDAQPRLFVEVCK